MNLQILNTIVIMVTAGIILWYTIETYKLRKQSVLQTEIQIRPVLIIIFDAKVDFIIKNIGNGIALNVETEEIVIQGDDTAFLVGEDINKPFRLSFDKINAISQNEEKTLPMKVFVDDREVTKEPFVEKSLMAELDSRYANLNYGFRVKYENINGNKYQTVGTTGKDGVHIKEISKV